MTHEEFEMLQEEMTDLELIDLAEKQVSKLAETGGRSHQMTVPPRVDDTDMILTELINRFKKRVHYTLPELPFEHAEELCKTCDYAVFACEPESNQINWGDAASFFHEGYEYARRFSA